MPDLTSNAATYRAGRYQYTGYVGVIPPTVVMSRAVNMASIPADQITSITFDDAYSGTGAYTDVREDMTVLVYDQNTSTLKGRLRVAAGGASSTVLQVNEYSPGTLQLANNDRFDVVSEFRVWDKLVEASALFRKDSRITFSAQTDDYKPVANGGGAVFTFVDDGQAYATILFDWTDSFPVDPDNSGGLTYSVDEKDATITVGSSTSSTCTMQVPAGFRHLELTVTDADNAASSTIQIPVYVYDNSTYTPLSASIDNLRFDGATKGWACDGLRLPKASQAALSSLPDGAMIVYFERETYSGSVASYGSNAPAAGRSHMKFVGYLVGDSLTITPEGDEVVFEAVSPLAILEQTAALPQLMIRDSSPGNWQEAKGLTVNIALHYLWYWHASIASIFDFLWPDGADLAYSRLAVEDTSSVAGQLRDIASSINVELTCDRLGRLLLIRDPNYLTLAERSARTVVYNATTADITELEERHTHRRTVKVVVGEGITPGATTAAQAPVFSLAPGKAPGEGTGTDTFSRKIATQTNLNRMTGERYASVNGLFWDESTGAIRHVPKGARWNVPDGYDWLDPAYMEFVTLTLPASSNARGIAYTTGTRWIVREVSIAYDAEAGSKDIQWTVDHETHGPSGVTDTRPQPSENGLPPFPSFDFTLPGWGDWSPAAPPSGITTGTGRIGMVLSDGTSALTSDFSTPAASGGPTWLNYALSGFSGTAQNFAEKAGSSPKAGWIVTSGNIYYVADLTSATPAASSQLAFGAASSYRNIDANYIHPGYAGLFVIVASTESGLTKIRWTDDGGANWNTGGAVGANAASQYMPALAISTHVAGKAFSFGWAVAVGSVPNIDLHITTDKGANWSIRTTNYDEDRAAGAIAIPYGDATDTRAFYGYDSSVDVPDNPDPHNGLMRGTIGSGQTDISPESGGTQYGPDQKRGRFTLSIPNGDRYKLLACVTDSTYTNYGVALTLNNEAATPVWTWIVGPDTTNPYRRGVLLDQTGDAAILFGLNGAVAYYDVATGVLDSRIGNLSTSAEVIAVFGW